MRLCNSRTRGETSRARYPSIALMQKGCWLAPLRDILALATLFYIAFVSLIDGVFVILIAYPQAYP